MVAGPADGFGSGSAAEAVAVGPSGLRRMDTAGSAPGGAGGKMVDGSAEVWADNIPLAARRAGGTEASPHQRTYYMQGLPLLRSAPSEDSLGGYQSFTKVSPQICRFFPMYRRSY